MLSKYLSRMDAFYRQLDAVLYSGQSETEKLEKAYAAIDNFLLSETCRLMNRPGYDAKMFAIVDDLQGHVFWGGRDDRRNGNGEIRLSIVHSLRVALFSDVPILRSYLRGRGAVMELYRRRRERPQSA